MRINCISHTVIRSTAPSFAFILSTQISPTLYFEKNSGRVVSPFHNPAGLGPSCYIFCEWVLVAVAMSIFDDFVFVERLEPFVVVIDRQFPDLWFNHVNSLTKVEVSIIDLDV